MLIVGNDERGIGLLARPPFRIGWMRSLGHSDDSDVRGVVIHSFSGRERIGTPQIFTRT